jgi:hypothetical protein
MEEEALYRTWCITSFGSGYWPVVKHTSQWVDEIVSLRAAKKPLFVFAIVRIEFCWASLLSGGRLSVVCIAIG